MVVFSKSFPILQQVRVVNSFTIFRGLRENMTGKVPKLRETHKSFGKIYKKCQEISQKKKMITETIELIPIHKATKSLLNAYKK